MRKLFYAGLIFFASSACVAYRAKAQNPPPGDPFAENIRKTEALTPEQELRSFHPARVAFKIRALIASEPLDS